MQKFTELIEETLMLIVAMLDTMADRVTLSTFQVQIGMDNMNYSRLFRDKSIMISVVPDGCWLNCQSSQSCMPAQL